MARVGGRVEGRVVVFCDEGEDVRYGVGGGGGCRREEMASCGAECDGQDAVEAEEGEGVGDGKAEAAGGGARALLLREAALEEGERGREGEAHCFEACDF